MKMSEAMKIIEGNGNRGYMVHFERKEGIFLCGDYFPDKHAGEPLIESLGQAWKLARSFADKTRGKCVNIFVVGADFVPVDDYGRMMIENR